MRLETPDAILMSATISHPGAFAKHVFVKSLRTRRTRHLAESKDGQRL